MFCQFLNMFCISRTLCIIATDQRLNIYFKSTQIIELQKSNERKKSLSLHSAVFPLKKGNFNLRFVVQNRNLLTNCFALFANNLFLLQCNLLMSRP